MTFGCDTFGSVVESIGEIICSKPTQFMQIFREVDIQDFDVSFSPQNINQIKMVQLPNLSLNKLLLT